MPSIYELKPRFQTLLRPAVALLARSGGNANQITSLAMALSFLMGGLVLRHGAVRWVMLLVPLALFVRMALNAIDGMLAREHGQQSRLGALLNELGDVLSDVALYLPFATLPGVNGAAVVLFVVFALLAEFSGVIALAIGSARRYEGPMGKSDRAFAVGLAALVMALGVSPGAWLSAGFVLLAVLSALTVINRARGALQDGGA
ncbi:CDP-alcohol phosphatidyltransferase family protein [Methylotetracoccus oryzae]|uniref:CDP-alcohol phosphatidyltransferase family protein n=1 Tax=Methylotetracoccus oryzae TaxID=1919059 RepID=UPI001118A77F|nr:CDP-alcohol phosphatidyltransferase family protein [Methylotetracoccus oryzae]